MKPVTLNSVRVGFYLDSVALMRMSRSVCGLPGVEAAALMMGTPANREILAAAGLLAATGGNAGAGDLIIAVRAESAAQAEAATRAAERQLDAPADRPASGRGWRPRSLRTAAAACRDANFALISVPGAFAASEAHKAVDAGLHTMIFSDNVPLSDEAALKRKARGKGVLVMGPDCGTAIIAGAPLAFANRITPGPIGIIGASGTGIQEVSCLIDRKGGGISHAIGVGGRDLHAAVGGISTLMAIDLLARDGQTELIVIIAKPPAAEVARAVLDRLHTAGKPAVVCFLGAGKIETPGNVRQVSGLLEAAEAALGEDADRAAVVATAHHGGGMLGLYSGGTLCAEAQVICRDAGLPVVSNAPVARVGHGKSGFCVMLDLGADEFTLGRPHPMLEPSVRGPPLIEALQRRDLGSVLVDVVIGSGAHPDPAGWLAATVKAHRGAGGPALLCAVTGTDADPQIRSRQESVLEDAGFRVAPSNADAARWALAVTQ